MNKALILVVEDDRPIRNLIVTTLKTHDYKYITAENGSSAILEASSHKPEIILLDLGLPDMEGVDVIKKVRTWSNVPIIVISARSEDVDKIEALDAGADDYLPKPFSTSELLARVRAMLRRKDNYVPDLLTYNDVVLNRSTYELGYDNKTQTLSGKEFQIAEMMMQQPNSIIATEQFITHIWGWDSHVDTSVVWVHISNLRKKIDAVNAPIEIRFVRNAGYILEDKQ